MNFYKKAINSIVERRKTDLFKASELFSVALQKSPKLLETEKAIRKIILTAAKTGQSADEAELNRLNKKKAELLRELNITPFLLNPPPHCKKCQDSGLINGKPCACAVRLALNENDENLKLPLHSFSDVDFSLYDTSVRLRSEEIFSQIEKLVGLYPESKWRNIVILGPSGTGKTFLAGCACQAILERGYSAVALTAFELINRALKYHTTFDETRLSYIEPLLSCDMLIIDDLGRESILKNITFEYLFMIINERMLNGKLTFVTTNLDKNGLLSRYDESVCSRLFDKSLSFARVLNGNDLRDKKR